MAFITQPKDGGTNMLAHCDDTVTRQIHYDEEKETVVCSI